MQFALLFLVVSLGCTTAPKGEALEPQSLLIRDTETMIKPWKLESSAMKADIDLLIYALKTAYGGRKFVPQNQFKTSILKLEKAKEQVSSTPLDFCKLLDEALLEIQDQHLFPYLVGMNCEALRSSRTRKGGVGSNLHSDPKKPWSYRQEFMGGKELGILMILDFPSPEDEVWKGFSKALEKAKKTAALVIDLRGNLGGSDSRGQELAKMLYGRNFSTPLYSQVKSQSAETMALLVNREKYRILALKNKKEKVPDYLLSRFEEAQRQFQLAIDGKLPRELEELASQGPPFDKQFGYKGPVAVLIDAECASSCESTLDFLELHPNVITIGENTNGSIHFGNVGFIVLPSSKVVVQMASDFWKYQDGRFIEGQGHTPKIKVVPGNDAFDVAKAQLSKL